MKKLCCLLLSALMLLSLAACGTQPSTPTDGGADSNDTPPAEGTVYEFKLGTDCSDPALSPDYNGYGEHIRKFCELVEEKTGGQVKITPYYESVLGAQPELFMQARDGELDFFYGRVQSAVDPRFAFNSVPFLFKDIDQAKRLIANPDGELYKLYADLCEEYGTHLIGQGVGTFRGVFSNKHAVPSADGMSDLTMRIYEDPSVKFFWTPICNASVISFNETYTALQTKTCDAMEIAGSVGIYSKFYEVCDYYTDLDWQIMSQGFIVSDKCWNSLPDDLRKTVIDCAWEASDYEYEVQKTNAVDALDELASLGCEVYNLTDSERQAWIDYARSLDNEYREYIGADFYDQVMAAIDADNAANS